MYVVNSVFGGRPAIGLGNVFFLGGFGQARSRQPSGTVYGSRGVVVAMGTRPGDVGGERLSRLSGVVLAPSS